MYVIQCAEYTFYVISIYPSIKYMPDDIRCQNEWSWNGPANRDGLPAAARGRSDLVYTGCLFVAPDIVISVL